MRVRGKERRETGEKREEERERSKSREGEG